MIELTDKLKTFWAEEYPDRPFEDIYKMSKDELISLKEDIVAHRQEYFQLEMAMKTLGNAAYGASANQYFYFYNVSLAGDITGECRNLTKTMWHKLEEFFHEDIWNMPELWKEFNFELDESKHEWYRTQPVSIYSDTDSLSENSTLLIKRNGQILKRTFIELWRDACEYKRPFGLGVGHQELCESDDEVLNWTEEKGLHFVPIKYIMKHKVSKARFKIKTKSGKEIIVTGDHSCVVFRDNKQITIKAKDINIKTDKILSVKR